MPVSKLCTVGMISWFYKEDGFQLLADLCGKVLASRGRRYERLAYVRSPAVVWLFSGNIAHTIYFSMS